MKTKHEELMENWQDASAVDMEEVKQEVLELHEIGELYSHSKTWKEEAFEDLAAAQKELANEAQNAIDCTKCSNCCTSFNCGEPKGDELKKIAEYLDEDPEEVAGKWTNGAKGRCPMLGDDGRCSVYEVRPSTCRKFPHLNGEANALKLLEMPGKCAKWCEDCPIMFHVGSNIVDAMEEKAAARRGWTHW